MNTIRGKIDKLVRHALGILCVDKWRVEPVQMMTYSFITYFACGEPTLTGKWNSKRMQSNTILITSAGLGSFLTSWICPGLMELMALSACNSSVIHVHREFPRFLKDAPPMHPQT